MKMLDALKKEYPHGHPDFSKITLEELALHSAKNHDYARDGDPVGNFKRVSSILALYPGLRPSSSTTVALIYALKQLDAVLWMLSQDYEGGVETIDTRLQDVHIYMKLARILQREK